MAEIQHQSFSHLRNEDWMCFCRSDFWEAGRARFGDADVEAASAIVAVAALLPTVTSHPAPLNFLSSLLHLHP